MNDCINKFINTGNYKDSLLHLESPVPFEWEILDEKIQLNNIHFFKRVFEKVNYRPTIYSFLERLLNNHEKYNWVDIENEYYHSLIELYEWGVTMRSPDYLPKIQRLNEEFECLRGKLEEYITVIQKDIIPIHSININGKINQLFGKYAQDFFKNDESKTITFLNFNYTNTIERYIGKGEDLNHEIIYIHGQLNNLDNPVIFGFGDEVDSYYEKIENLKINEFLDNFKSLWYFKTDNYQKLLRFIESEAFDIEILGHSCGLSDRVLLSTVFQHENCQTIKIHYHQRSKTENDFFRKTQEISRHFRDKAKMRKVIVDRSKCQSMNDI